MHKTSSYRWRVKTYGMTIDEYEQMLEKQNHCCAICLEKDKKFNIDHCHKTGKIGAILCHNCNTLLGIS